MKAIETKWKGYRFRSRTEARWAVFLEKLGITFDYEVEGVLLPSGPYLPDFRLNSFSSAAFPGGHATQQPVWLEIKGSEPTEEEQIKCAELAAASGSPVLLAVGAPDFGPQVLLFDDAIDDAAKEVVPHLIGHLAFIEVGEGEDAAIAVGRPRRPNEEDEGPISDSRFEEMWVSFSGPFARILGVQGAKFVNNDKILFNLSDRVKAAYDAARAARFEFGQADKRWRW